MSENLLQRYQRCAIRIWQMFPSDPLPDTDPSQAWIERLESIIDHGLLVPSFSTGSSEPENS